MSSIDATAPLGQRYLKPVLWSAIALAFVSVLFYSDLPLVLHPDQYSAKLIHDRLPLIPHALGGLAALLIGRCSSRPGCASVMPSSTGSWAASTWARCASPHRSRCCSV